MENKVEFGIKNLTFWELTADGTDSAAPTYGSQAYKVPGIVKMKVDYDGSSSDIYADNVKYWSGSSVTGNSGEFEVAALPSEFMAKAFGWRIDANGGLVEVPNGKNARFAMAYEIDGDSQSRRYINYDVTLSIPSDEHNTTTETITPDTRTVSWSGKPQNISGESIMRYGLPKTESNATAYNAWFTKPTMPAAIAAA